LSEKRLNLSEKRLNLSEKRLNLSEKRLNLSEKRLNLSENDELPLKDWALLTSAHFSLAMANSKRSVNYVQSQIFPACNKLSESPVYADFVIVDPWNAKIKILVCSYLLFQPFLLTLKIYEKMI
jgi:hypothetical protein